MRFTSLQDMDTEDFCRYSLYRQGPGGQYVTTAEKRFEDLDAVAVPLIEAQPRPSIHDIGVSSGITSLELFEELVERGIDAEFNISDKNLECFRTGSFIQRVYDPDGSFFEGYFFGLYCQGELSNKYIVSKFLGRLLNRPPGVEKREVFGYLDRRVRSLVETGKIKLLSCDILNNDFSERFTYVRCMNLLILQYFSTDELNKAVGHIVRSLKEGGVFQVGRTLDGINHVTFFKKTGDKLTPLKHINGGAEINGAIDRYIVWGKD